MILAIIEHDLYRDRHQIARITHVTKKMVHTEVWMWAISGWDRIRSRHKACIVKTFTVPDDFSPEQINALALKINAIGEKLWDDQRNLVKTYRETIKGLEL